MFNIYRTFWIFGVIPLSVLHKEVDHVILRICAQNDAGLNMTDCVYATKMGVSIRAGT